MEQKSSIIIKVKKLLALANSSNEHEAALAASHAQRLLSEHNLAMADIDHTYELKSADRVETKVSKTLPKWTRHLSAAVCTAFDCQAIHHPADGKMTFIGIGADVQIAIYIFSYLDHTIKKLCGAYIKKDANKNISSRDRNFMRQSYCLGAVSTITERLREQKLQTPVTPGALVPVKEGLIKKALLDLGSTRTIRSRKSYINSDAYMEGRQDGRHVRINKAISGSSPVNKVISGKQAAQADPHPSVYLSKNPGLHHN